MPSHGRHNLTLGVAGFFGAILSSEYHILDRSGLAHPGRELRYQLSGALRNRFLERTEEVSL